MHSLDTNLDNIRARISEEMNMHLTRLFTQEEILTTLKQMNLSKSPGPDGMSVLFFHKYWHVIDNRILNTMLKVLNMV